MKTLDNSPISLSCRGCGSQIPQKPGRGRTKVWCEACPKESRGYPSTSKPTKPKVERNCLNCQTTFITSISFQKFCSEPCNRDHQNILRGHRPASQNGRSKICQHCSREMEGRPRFFCDNYCRKRVVYRLPPPADIPCEVCSTMFRPRDKYARHCSPRCCNKKRSDKIQPIKRRGQKVVPYEVFHRDKWICQFCGVKTLKSLRGTYEPRAPEIDHIVPLTMGGEHTYKNCHTACRACNSRKGARIAGQLRMFG
jgi:5-methylcytosine-specific restriction endonuclease McrA